MKVVLLFGAAAVLAFATGLILTHFGMLAFVHAGAEVRIPDLLGLEVGQARSLLESRGFTGIVEREVHTAEFREGRVVEQRPHAGELLRKGRKVYLTASLGVLRVHIPGVEGTSYRQAGILLRQRGLSVGSVCRVHHPRVSRDLVIAQDPAPGSQRPEGARVDLLVSLGPAGVPYLMPDLTGRPFREVERLLREHRIAVGERTVLIDRSVLPSTVIRQDPPAGSRIESGDEVDLVISSRS